MDPLKTLRLACCIYFVGAVVTFGNAAVFFEKRGDAEVRKCEQRTDFKDQAKCGWYRSDGIAAFFSAMAWPFYWSYRSFSAA